MNTNINSVKSGSIRPFDPHMAGYPRPVTDRLAYALRHFEYTLPPTDPRWRFLDEQPLASSSVRTARYLTKRAKDLWQKRIEASWRGPGLSNAPYLDAATSTQLLGLKARLMFNPGTLKLRVGGMLQSTVAPGVSRGQIRWLSNKSRSRILELTRELEAAEIYPQLMISLTYPRDWEAAISPEHAQAVWEFRRAWGRLNAWRYVPRGPGWGEGWQQRRAEVRAGLHRLRELGPDGKRVKAHLEAFRKRFERRYGTAWSLIWKLEFQRRGAPHIHLYLWNCGELDLAELRTWVSQAWVEIVAGCELNAYLDPQNRSLYDLYRESGGREFAEAMLGGMGLEVGIWNHLRAGTKVEAIRERHWGYLAKEVQGGMGKAYQHEVPRRYRNVGRWWGYWRYRRAGWTELVFDLASASMREVKEAIVKPVEAALKTLPRACRDFRERAKAMLTRFLKTGSFSAQKIDRDGVVTEGPYGYLTVWGHSAVQAAIGAL
ncbi:rolling circle replication-associated protein [Meiothermus granaticius]|uniref:Replication-associated protein ORF2/G2P domain-containing protein n=1 Tax=Meiothermus granaticius NBRC 107808 TaxID=1227551 RepID=A0A399F1M8_9DEIN|nr:hypothetical protein [Meiothermus granaticius]RIH90687.1 hypothetical protein Mgrana_03199 [Meiothermus granaticius NBRC 107808]GEM88469.1 hypothetical protein MGR01S_30940 [Meiothermus granaticius NBRC 107808]